MNKWMVSYDVEYYPFMNIYDTYEEAKVEYDKANAEKGCNVYLSEIVEQKGNLK